jgi:hypothetical protein
VAGTVSSTFTATGPSNAFNPTVSRQGNNPASFNVSLRGTFVATVQIERCMDGTNWEPLTIGATQDGIWYAPCSETFEECEAGVQYRLNCTAYTSGTVTYRISQ